MYIYSSTYTLLDYFYFKLRLLHDNLQGNVVLFTHYIYLTVTSYFADSDS